MLEARAGASGFVVGWGSMRFRPTATATATATATVFAYGYGLRVRQCFAYGYGHGGSGARRKVGERDTPPPKVWLGASFP
jgi:hypothetical protein